MANSDSTTTTRRIRNEYLKRAAYEQDVAAQAIKNMMQFCELAELHTGFNETIKRCLEAVGIIIERERYSTPIVEDLPPACTCTQRLYGVNHGINCPLRQHEYEEA